MNIFEAIQTQQKTQALKKTMFEFLKERYPRNEMIIERIAHQLITDSDVHQFMVLITDVCEMGYLRAVSDHKEQLDKLGISARVIQSDKNAG